MFQNNINKQVVRLDLAKQLHAVGVEQDSYFYWTQYSDDDTLWYINTAWHVQQIEHAKIVSAFTVGELGILLPEWCTSCRNPEGLWDCYAPAMYGEVATVYNEDSEANARANLLLSLYQHYPHYPSLDYATMAG